MSKHIIIDWQRDGLFVAMGSRRGNNVTIDTLVTTKGGGGAHGSSTAISTQLFALAKKLDLHKSEATIIAPREVLEFRTLTVPRGQADEVPDMVRFQAQRQMANIGDNWPLDYILLPDQPGQEGISALAATISPAHMAEIEATCSDLGIHLTRVLARPLEIARWGVAAGGLADAEASLIIAVSLTHADLLLVSRGSLIQIRGTRLPEDPAVMTNALVAEIRRSIMAAASDLNNQSITKILLIAAPELAERVEAAVTQATGASVAIVDPASMLPSSLAERHELALRSANRLAAIAGVIGNAAPDKRDIIDLKNCKRREPKKARTREIAMIGGAVAIVLLGGIYWWWSAHARLDDQIRAAQAEEKQKKELVAANIKAIKHRDDVDKFLAGSINWLDEVVYIASKLPPAEDIMLSNPTFEVLSDNSGQIKFTADSRDAQSINAMEQGLSDKSHAVASSGSKERPTKNGNYGWSATEVVRVTGRGWDPLAPKSKASADSVKKPEAVQSRTASPARRSGTTRGRIERAAAPISPSQSAPAQSAAQQTGAQQVTPSPATPSPATPSEVSPSGATAAAAPAEATTSAATATPAAAPSADTAAPPAQPATVPEK